MPEMINLNQVSEGILSVHEKTYKVAALLKAATELFPNHEEVENGLKDALRSAGLLDPDDLFSLASSLLTPKPDQQAIQEAKWFHHGLRCQLLVPGEKNWINGRVRLRVVAEFVPDVIVQDSVSPASHEDRTSSLDDLRRDSVS